MTVRQVVVKRSRELDLVEEEAGVPYGETALARKAARSRRRLFGLLLVGTLLLVVEALYRRSFGWGFAGAATLGTAWGLRGSRLGGIVAAALLAVLAVLLPLGLLFLGTPDTPDLLAMVVSAVWGLVALPDLVTLLRDAELQHAYGRWARRE